jgi:hypothetical protein
MRTCELKSKVGSEPAVDVLLALYKEYKPSAVTVALPSRSKPLHTLLKVRGRRGSTSERTSAMVWLTIFSLLFSRGERAVTCICGS